MYDFNLMLPNISAKKYSTDDKFRLLKSYLTELNEALAFALSSVDESNFSSALTEKINVISENTGDFLSLKKEITDKFTELKSQIIRTANEIEEEYTTAINSTKTQIETNASHTYTALSDFGAYCNTADTRITQNSDAIALANSDIDFLETSLDTYKVSNNAELTLLENSVNSKVEQLFVKKSELDETALNISSQITQTATDITEQFSEDISSVSEDVSSVGGRVSELVSSLDVYIRRGELENGIYGIEIGRSDSGMKARFTNDRLSFFQGNAEIAYISGNNLYITRAQILDYLEIGNAEQGYFTFDVTGNGLEVRWSFGN